MPWLNIAPASGSASLANPKKTKKKLAYSLIFYERHDDNLGLLEWRENKE